MKRQMKRRKRYKKELMPNDLLIGEIGKRQLKYYPFV